MVKRKVARRRAAGGAGDGPPRPVRRTAPGAAACLLAAVGCTSRGGGDAGGGGNAGGGGARCGPLACALYDAPEAAFAAVLDPPPRVLAVGEAHAQRGGAAGASVTKRFAERLLPVLGGRASDLLVELMLPPAGCARGVEVVRERQAPAVAPQADTNQGEYVALGEAARRLGLSADALRPGCADLDAIGRAGDDAVGAMLTTIARLTEARAAELVARAAPGKIVVTYGGALHNDLEPRPGREAWTFGPALDRAAGGKYVELDVFAPEAVRDNEVWRALPWYAHYDAARFAAKAVLFRTGPKAYALVLPREAP
jgi:hypothetical protein